jgi:hypothetical protein
MSYPQIVDYNEAVQHPSHAFFDPELKDGSVKENSLGLPLVLSGGFALTYTVSTPAHKYAVRCFHREIPSIEKKYEAIATKLKSLGSNYFVDFDFQGQGIRIRQGSYPIVRMDWVEGDPLGIWLDKNFDKPAELAHARDDFGALATFLEREGIAHGDIQNGNVMLSKEGVKLIDYDGMFVPGLRAGDGSETGHKHFQHPDRRATDYGPAMDRFSFIALDLSLRAIMEDKNLYARFREGGETIVFKANDFADPRNSEIFRLLLANNKLAEQVRNFALVCDAEIEAVPTLEDFQAGRNIPAAKAPVSTSATAKATNRVADYIAPFPVVDAADFAAASQHVGDRVELIGRIVAVEPGVGRRGGQATPFVNLNFTPSPGDMVKIAVWSEGLEHLAELPSNSLVGRWVSVKGLIEPPAAVQNGGDSSLMVTVEQFGQMQWLNETDAKFRLASIGKPMPSRNRDIVKALKDGPSNAASTNRAIVDRYVAQPVRPRVQEAAPPYVPPVVPSAPPVLQKPVPIAPLSGIPITPPHSVQPSAVIPVTVRPNAGIPRWIWIGVGIAALGLILLEPRFTDFIAPLIPRH